MGPSNTSPSNDDTTDLKNTTNSRDTHTRLYVTGFGGEHVVFSCQATTYDIYDAYNPKKDEPPKLVILTLPQLGLRIGVRGFDLGGLILLNQVAGLEVSTDKEMKKVPDYPMDQKQSGSVST
eukprot:1057422-Amorphochlora_amoeboformis.AAC.1